MHSFFDPENGIFSFLHKVEAMLALNLSFLLCCVPVFTIGAAVTALNKATQNMVFENESATVKTFLRAFSGNFKQATAIWVPLALILSALCGNLWYVSTHIFTTAASVSIFMMLAAVVLLLAMTAYLFPLIARYEGSVRSHLRNAMTLTVAKLPITLLLLTILVFPLLIWYFLPELFVELMLLWMLFGFSLSSCCVSRLMKPVFIELEATV